MEEYLEAGFPKLVLLFVAIIISLIAIRLTYVFLRSGKPFVVPPERVSTMIVLGSGMMNFDKKKKKKLFLV